MVARFRSNPRFQDELGNDPAFRRFMLARAIDVRKGIPQELPVGRGGGRSVAPFGRDLFAEVEGSGRDMHSVAGTRWRLGHIIEFGSRNNPAYAPVRKTAIRLGYRFVRH